MDNKWSIQAFIEIGFFEESTSATTFAVGASTGSLPLGAAESFPVSFGDNVFVKIELRDQDVDGRDIETCVVTFSNITQAVEAAVTFPLRDLSVANYAAWAIEAFDIPGPQGEGSGVVSGEAFSVVGCTQAKVIFDEAYCEQQSHRLTTTTSASIGGGQGPATHGDLKLLDTSLSVASTRGPGVVVCTGVPLGNWSFVPTVVAEQAASAHNDHLSRGVDFYEGLEGGEAFTFSINGNDQTVIIIPSLAYEFQDLAGGLKNPVVGLLELPTRFRGPGFAPRG